MEAPRQLSGWPAARLAAVMTINALLIVALWTPAGAHTGTTTHLWSAHIKPMGEPGTINATGNPVHWTKLKGVPSSIADGVDDNSPMAISIADAGTGLICNSGCNEGSLLLPVGEWAIFAKIVVLQTEPYETDMFVRCQLRTDVEIDETWLDMTSNYAGRGVIHLQGIASVESETFAKLWCADDAVGDVEGEDLSMLAIRVND